jgi:hypothetical protein
MKCRRLLTILSVAILAWVFARAAPAQDSAADASHPAIVITKFSPPVYPAIARTAHITGDVTVTLGILNDGAIESAAAISGPPLLHTAALQSAQQSQFARKNCRDAIKSYSLIYTFKLIDQPSCSPAADLRITQSENHVTIRDHAVCFL